MVRKFLRGINVLLLLLIIISAFSSCANEMYIFEGNNNKQINFSISVPVWKNTDSLETTKTSRSTPIMDTSFGTDKSFNLIADQNDGAGNYTTLIDKESVSFTNNIWQTTPSHYYWSGIANKTINFYAYYPTTISTSITHTAGSSPTLSYIVPSDASNQIDIITAINPNISGSTATSTPLTFNHIFAAVKFAVGTSGLPSGTIKSITIDGIKNSGTYTFGSGWSLGSTISSFTVSPSAIITGTSGENIASDAFTLMMIPQIFTDADVSLVYNNGTTFSAKISGTWNAGEAYTYKLSKTIVFNYNYTGASQTFTVPYAGTYKLEVWGAQGGTMITSPWTGKGGNGGYTTGNINLQSGYTLYVYVGGQGEGFVDVNTKPNNLGGWNGGGTCYQGASGGGGATDIRTVLGPWNSITSLNSRIIVGGGGGGSNDYTEGGSGGGLVGGNGSASSDVTNPIIATGGTQTSGGVGWINGSFGIGGGAADSYGDGGAGGGGWYGGAKSQGFNVSGGGGSSYYGNLKNPKTTDGVQTGNGYARITFISAN
ncbi:fimbrillin family protein [Segatella paludivivens]|uniref:fimbrillin family protein n=1 Tax=Segatella paludivivens TaxID=185294 RepID=UPI00039E28A1|nr:fimbrillin family protein [Segatella paludivivens]